MRRAKVLPAGANDRPNRCRGRKFIREIHRELKDLDQRLTGLDRQASRTRDPVGAQSRSVASISESPHDRRRPIT